MSHSFVLIHLFLTTALCLGVGCRAFSAKMKDERTEGLSRPSLYLDEVKKVAQLKVKDYLEAGLAAEKKANGVLDEKLKKPHYIEAEGQYWQALSMEPCNVKCIESWGRVALYGGTVEESEKKLTSLAKENIDCVPLSLVYARILCAEKKYEEAQSHLLETLQVVSNVSDVAFEMLSIYFKAGQYKEAMAFYEVLLKDGMVSAEMMFSYAGWWYEMTAAFTNGRKNIHPHGFPFTEAQCRENLRAVTRSIVQLANEIDGQAGDDFLKAVCICDFLGNIEEYDLFKEVIKRLDNVPNVGDKVGYILTKGKIFLKMGEKALAVQALQPVEKIMSVLAEDMLKLLLEEEIALQAYGKAARVNELLMMKHSDVSKECIELQMDMYLRSGEYENVLVMGQVPAKLEAGMHYRMGMAYKSKKNYAAAYRQFKKYEAKEKEHRFENNVYYCLNASMVCVGLKKIEEAISYAAIAWKLKPDLPELCNFYGYVLADAGQQLELAHELIEKAVNANPKNLAYLDSLAWVLYRQGKYAEAYDILLKMKVVGLPEEDEEGVMYSHLGDILFANGKKDEALDSWKKALSQMTDAELIQKEKEKIERSSLEPKGKLSTENTEPQINTNKHK